MTELPHSPAGGLVRAEGACVRVADHEEAEGTLPHVGELMGDERVEAVFGEGELNELRRAGGLYASLAAMQFGVTKE